MKRTGSQLKRKFYTDTLRRALSRTLKGRPARDENHVREIYDRHYAESGNRELLALLEHPEFVRMNGRVKNIKSGEYKKVLVKNVSDAIISCAAKSILDLGCGRGIFLLALAALHPSVTVVRGIELSPSGVAYAKRMITDPPVGALAMLTGLSEADVRDHLADRDIEVIQGSIRSLPYADNSFDFVYSNSVIEQFPRDYMLPFREAYRVTLSHAFFSEPFREAEPNVFRRLHLKNLDYFNASYREVEKAGFFVERFSVPLLQKFAFNTGALLCVKRRKT